MYEKAFRLSSPTPRIQFSVLSRTLSGIIELEPYDCLSLGTTFEFSIGVFPRFDELTVCVFHCCYMVATR